MGFDKYDEFIRFYEIILQEVFAAFFIISSNRVISSDMSLSSINSYLFPRLNLVQFEIIGLNQFHSIDVYIV